MPGDGAVDVTKVNAAAHLDFLAGVAGAAESPVETAAHSGAPLGGNAPASITPAVEAMLRDNRGMEAVETILMAHPDVRAALSAVDDVELLEVVDKAGFTAAGSVLARLKKGERAATEYKKKGREPLVEQVKTFDRACLGIITAIGQAVNALNEKMTQWRKAEEVLNAQLRSDADEAGKKLQEELAAKARAAGIAEPPQVEVFIAPPPKTIDVAPEDGGGRVTVTSRWTYEVEQPNDVPREYCEPSAGKLRAAVNAGVRAIPGVRIYQQDTAGYKA